MNLAVNVTPSGRMISDPETGEILAVVSNKLTPDQVAELLRNAPALREVVTREEEPEFVFPA